MIKFKNIKFGAASAEQEATFEPHLLNQGFYDAWKIVDQAVKGPKSLFLGYKGSGKSSIGEHLRLTSEGDSSIHVNHIYLSDFPYENFKNIVGGVSSPESRFPSAWTWILLLHIVELFSRSRVKYGESEDDFDRLVTKLKSEGLFPGVDLRQIVVASSKPKVRAKLGEMIDMDWDPPNSQKMTDLDFLQIVDKLKDHAFKFKSKSKHLLVIDGLDDILFQKEIQYQSIAALILEYTRLNYQFLRANVPAKIIVLCRTELYERLPMPNKNKIRQDSAIELDWYHSPSSPESSHLVHMINKKAQLSDGNIKALFVQYFPQTIGKRDTRILFFLLSQTRHTPRDLNRLLHYIQLCVRGEKPTEPEIFAGLRHYSMKYFYPEIRDELDGYLKLEQIDEIMSALASIKKWVFTLAEFSNELRGTDTLKKMTLTKVVELLFDCSAVGNVVKGRNENFVYTFKYRNRHVNFDANQDLTVHRGLFQALRL
ncbi:MAG: hypothetical protein HKN50_08800 [Gammaproteobacteria bacterium]|nr:hypothetical protein [Gammaproteobacteria bacterium]